MATLLLQFLVLPGPSESQAQQVIHLRAEIPGPWEPHSSSHLHDTLGQSLTLSCCVPCPPLQGGLVTAVSISQALCN